MNVLVFGASGGTGRELIRQGLELGHAMTAFVRNPGAFGVNHADLKVIQGDVVDRRSVGAAVEGQDAAISALGASTLLKREKTMIVGVHNILTALEQSRVRRFIYLSVLGVHDVREQLNPLGRYVIAPLVLRNVAADHEVNEAMIKQSQLDWTIVRAPNLTNKPRTGTYRSGESIKANSLIPEISRGDLAEFMLRQLHDSTYVRCTPTVM